MVLPITESFYTGSEHGAIKIPAFVFAMGVLYSSRQLNPEHFLLFGGYQNQRAPGKGPALAL